MALILKERVHVIPAIDIFNCRETCSSDGLLERSPTSESFLVEVVSYLRRQRQKLPVCTCAKGHPLLWRTVVKGCIIEWL